MLDVVSIVGTNTKYCTICESDAEFWILYKILDAVHI